MGAGGSPPLYPPPRWEGLWSCFLSSGRQNIESLSFTVLGQHSGRGLRPCLVLPPQSSFLPWHFPDTFWGFSDAFLAPLAVFGRSVGQDIGSLFLYGVLEEDPREESPFFSNLELEEQSGLLAHHSV